MVFIMFVFCFSALGRALIMAAFSFMTENPLVLFAIPLAAGVTLAVLDSHKDADKAEDRD
jgi:hypothetical protein